MDSQVNGDKVMPGADAMAALDQALDELRDILSEPERRRADELAQRVAELEQRTGDDAS